MKYAITGPRGAIFRIVDEEPQHAQHYVQITDEQAETVSTEEGRFFVIDSQLKTQQEVFAELRWDNEIGAWSPKPPPPAPASIPTHQFRGQLILDGHDPNAIRAMLDQETNPTARLLNLNEWDTGQVVYRNHALVTAVGPLLGYDTAEKLDDFFRRAQNYKHPGIA
jgi:hypothetical protein